MKNLCLFLSLVILTVSSCTKKVNIAEENKDLIRRMIERTDLG